MKSLSPISNSSRKESLEKFQKNKSISPKASKPIMTEQLVMPPARVWDKIEKILDEQDNRIKNANHLITSSFSPKQKHNNKPLLVACLASITIVAALLLILL